MSYQSMILRLREQSRKESIKRVRRLQKGREAVDIEPIRIMVGGDIEDGRRNTIASHLAEHEEDSIPFGRIMETDTFNRHENRRMFRLRRGKA